MKFKEALNERRIVWKIKNKDDLEKLGSKDTMIFGPTKTPEEALDKVEGKMAEWIIVKIGNQYFGVTGSRLDPENVGGKVLNINL